MAERGAENPAVNPTILGVPRSAAAEVIVFFAVALLVDAVFLGGTRFLDYSPHPFWLFVLVVAAHYGTETGVFASLLAIVLAFAGNLPARDPLQTESVYMLSVFRQPALWFFSAVVLGELRNRQRRKFEELASKFTGSQKERVELSVNNEALRLTNDRLGKRTVGQVETNLSLVQAARTLETQDADAVFHSVGALIDNLLAPSAYSIYLAVEQRLDLVVQFTDGNAPTALQTYRVGDALFDAVVGRREVVHIASGPGLEILGRDGVIAGPLIHAESGRMVGMLKIEAMPLANLELRSIETFKMLSDWIGAAYHNAQTVEEANKSRIRNAESQLFTDAYYQQVSTFLLALAERARFEVTQMTVRIRIESNGSHDSVKAAIQATVLSGLRTTDLAFDYHTDRNEYVVLLPMTPMKNTALLADRLRTMIGEAVGEAVASSDLSITFEALHVPAAKDVKPWHRAVIRRTDPYSLPE